MTSEDKSKQQINISGRFEETADGEGVKKRSQATIDQRGQQVERQFNIANLGKLIVNFMPGPSSHHRDLRNRQALLTLVENFWVKGVLENSLHGVVLIELELEERQEAVEYPWEMVLRRPGKENRTLPQDVNMAKAFDEVSQNLLILGEPGSGKTTMLLELARETIDHAKDDETQPIPVVFNLSSWNDPRQSIADWLVVELNTKYNIPKKIAQGWINDDALLLLLDGLDEVVERLRDSCVRAINDFRQEHLMPLVMCSRIADYERLARQLRLDSAILIKPLTPQQIEDYLRQDSLALKTVRATLQHDEVLQELAKTPLMLSIMALVFKDVKGPAFNEAFNAAFDSPASRRKYLFDAYIERMFERRGPNPGYTTEQTIRWLTWLAQKMVEHSQTVFLIERMEPTWLSTQRHSLTYVLGSLPFIVLSIGLYTSLSFGLVCSALTGVGTEPSDEMIAGLLGGLGLGLLSGLGLAGTKVRKIELIEGLQLSWKALHKWVLFIILSFPIGTLAMVLTNRGLENLVVFLILISTVALLYGLVPSLGGSLSVVELETRTVPNQGVWQTARNSLRTGLLCGLYGSLVGGLLGGPLGGLIFGFLSILCGALFVGGLAFIQHFVLRFTMYRNDYIPWRYADFLDYAAECIFLRKVGGGYVFIHRLLLEHFAAMGEEEIERLASDSS